MQVRDFASVWEGEYIIELRDDSKTACNIWMDKYGLSECESGLRVLKPVELDFFLYSLLNHHITKVYQLSNGFTPRVVVEY